MIQPNRESNPMIGLDLTTLIQITACTVLWEADDQTIGKNKF